MNAAPRIRALLVSLAWAKRRLDRAASPELRADARAEIIDLTHSLWLAGYQPENEEA